MHASPIAHASPHGGFKGPFSFNTRIEDAFESLLPHAPQPTIHSSAIFQARAFLLRLEPPRMPNFGSLYTHTGQLCWEKKRTLIGFCIVIHYSFILTDDCGCPSNCAQMCTRRIRFLLMWSFACFLKCSCVETCAWSRGIVACGACHL